MTFVVTDSKEAAKRLIVGPEGPEVVDYQPGDGTRYEVMLFRVKGERLFLALLNIGPWTVQLRPGRSQCADYVVAGMPRGCWSAMRPLLVAIGMVLNEKGGTFKMALGDEVMHRERDAHEEFEVRGSTSTVSKTYAERDEDKHNLAIGKLVRNLMEAEGYRKQGSVDV